MDLWIRSQDKLKLVKVNYVYIMDNNEHFTIYGETIDSSPIIGRYKTKERALEVLDEIHNFIENDGSETTMINDNTKIEFTTTTIRKKVYEMPKE